MQQFIFNYTCKIPAFTTKFLNTPKNFILTFNPDNKQFMFKIMIAESSYAKAFKTFENFAQENELKETKILSVAKQN